MYRPRVIPCLLLKDLGLVKSINFKNYTYIGDPLNAVKIFNEKKADELIFLDITATREGRKPNFELIQEIGEECLMPFTVGGGIHSMDDINQILASGAEKVSLNSALQDQPELIEKAASKFGAQSVVASIDVSQNWLGKEVVITHSGKKKIKVKPEVLAKEMAERGAGEILITSVAHEGKMEGYNLELTERIASAVPIPVIANGGAGQWSHFLDATEIAGASAVAVGSLFIYQGPKKGVLINFPTQKDLMELFNPA